MNGDQALHPRSDASRLSPGQLAQVACLLEATARKPGNVHRYRDFEDLHFLDFLLSATAIAGPLDRAPALVSAQRYSPRSRPPGRS